LTPDSTAPAPRATAAGAEVHASFLLGSEEFALDVKQVQEVVNMPTAVVPLPLAPDFVCGCFDLRGAIIPVIDMARLLDRPAAAAGAARKTVVVEHHGVRLGLVFDDTCRVIRSGAEARAAFDYAPESRHGVISGVLKTGDALVRLLDLERLSSLGDVPHVTIDTARDHAARAGRARRRCVSFSVAGIRLAFPIGSIFEIVPARAIEPSPLQDRLCGGLMRIRNRIVPIIRFGLLLKAAAADAPAGDDQHVIVLETGSAYVGLLVDSVDAIETYAQDDLMPVPSLSAGRVPLFLGCLDVGARGHIFLLDGPGVLAHDEIVRVLGQQRSLFRDSHGADPARQRRAGLRQPYLWIETRQAFALPMRAVREIVDAQGRLVPMPGAPQHVPGMINLRGQMVPVVDMRGFLHLGGETACTPETKIVVLDQGEALVGLRVDAVRSILQVDEASRIPVPKLLRLSLPESIRSDVVEVIEAGNSGERPVHLLLLDCRRLFTALEEPAVEALHA
jgi:purine-binding chemotaxis protein CheW